jgi:cytochrome c peroxidase
MVLPPSPLPRRGDQERWLAPESTDNMNTNRVGRLGLSEAEEDALVAFMQTLTDGFMHADLR